MSFQNFFFFLRQTNTDQFQHTLKDWRSHSVDHRVKRFWKDTECGWLFCLFLMSTKETTREKWKDHMSNQNHRLIDRTRGYKSELTSDREALHYLQSRSFWKSFVLFAAFSCMFYFFSSKPIHPFTICSLCSSMRLWSRGLDATLLY